MFVLYSVLTSCIMSTFGKGSWLTGPKRRISSTACLYNWSHSSSRLRPPYASTLPPPCFTKGPLHIDFSVKYTSNIFRQFQKLQIYPDSSKNVMQLKLSCLYSSLMKICWDLGLFSAVAGVSPNNDNSWILLLSVYYIPRTILRILCVLG